MQKTLWVIIACNWSLLLALAALWGLSTMTSKCWSRNTSWPGDDQVPCWTAGISKLDIQSRCLVVDIWWYSGCMFGACAIQKFNCCQLWFPRFLFHKSRDNVAKWEIFEAGPSISQRRTTLVSVAALALEGMEDRRQNWAWDVVGLYGFVAAKSHTAPVRPPVAGTLWLVPSSVETWASSAAAQAAENTMSKR